MNKIPSMAQRRAQERWSAKTPEQQKASQQKRMKNGNAK